MAKKADSPYDDNSAARNWIKIKNPSYSQKGDSAMPLPYLSACSVSANPISFTFDGRII